MGKIIIVTGNTGVGKTSLVNAIAKNGNFEVGIEQHLERPFQLLFANNTQFAFANQVDYLLYRAEQESALREKKLPGIIDGGLDQDFHGFTKLFHSRGLLGDSEFDLCQRFYQFCRNKLEQPDLIIHLYASKNVIQQRLSQRDRINIASSADLDNLGAFLEEWLLTIPLEKIIRLDVSDATPTYSKLLPELLLQIQSKIDSLV